jgi:hypothetical protein
VTIGKVAYISVDEQQEISEATEVHERNEAVDLA